MSSENALIQKIEADTEAVVAEVRSDAAAAVERIEADTKAKVADLQAEHEKQLEKKVAHAELVALSRAKQDANIAVQAAKREEIDSVFAAVAEEITALSSDEYVKFFAAQAAKILPEKAAEVTKVTAPANRASETEAILKEVKLSGDVTAEKSVAAGLIVHTKDGVYDVTLNRLFADNKAAMEMDVVAALTA